MAGRLNRFAYQQLVDENIEWLMSLPRTLERDHIKLILDRAVEYEYGPIGEQQREAIRLAHQIHEVGEWSNEDACDLARLVLKMFE